MESEQSGLHTRIALFLIAAYKSEHGEQPHAIDVSWMAGVLQRVSGQIGQTLPLDAPTLEASLRSELTQAGLCPETVESATRWSLNRMSEALRLIT